MNSEQLKKLLCKYLVELYNQGLLTDIGGNASFKDPRNNSFWITPSGIRKNQVRPEQFMEIAIESGQVLSHTTNQGLKPSVEWPMHLEIFKQTNCVAIIHAHPPYATAYSLLENPPPIPRLTAELQILVPKIIVTPYAQSGTRHLGEVVVRGLKEIDVVILKNHGTVAISNKTEDPFIDAIIKSRAIEETLKLYTLAKQIGNQISEFPK